MVNNAGINLSKVLNMSFEKQVKEHPIVSSCIAIGITIGVPVAIHYLKRACDKDFEHKKHEFRMEEIKAKRKQTEIKKNDKQEEAVNETSVNHRSKSVTLSDIDLSKFDGHYDDDQLIGKLISVGDTVVIYGDSGVGKSTFTYQLALSIARGESCSVIPEQYKTTKDILQQQVLYYDFEHKEKDLYRIFGDEDLSECNRFNLVFPPEIKDLKGWIIDVKDRLTTEIKNDVVVFLDNITCINPNADTNTVKDFIREQLGSVQKEGEARGQRITFIIVFHTNKKGEQFGSVNFRNLSSNVLLLKKSDGDSNKLILKVEKNRQYGDMTGKEFLEEKKCSESGWKYFIGEEIYDKSAVEAKEEAKEREEQPESKYSKEDWQRILEISKQGVSLRDAADNMKGFWQEHGIMNDKGKIKTISHATISYNISLYCKECDPELYDMIMSMHKSGMTNKEISRLLREERGINMKENIIGNIIIPPKPQGGKNRR